MEGFLDQLYNSLGIDCEIAKWKEPVCGGQLLFVSATDLGILRKAMRIFYLGKSSVVFVPPEFSNEDKQVFIDEWIRRKKSGIEETQIFFGTSGTSGQKKWVIHDRYSLTAALKRYAMSFDDRDHSVIITLPLYHVGGFMSWLRAMAQGCSIHCASYRELTNHRMKGPIVSLVPTQVNRLIDHRQGVAFLKRCHRVFIGGAATPIELINQLRKYSIPAVFTYGMTETAAMVAVASLEELSEGSPVYQAMDGIRTEHDDDGCLRIFSNHLFRGYLGDVSEIDEDSHKTNDKVSFLSENRFIFKRRADRIINTGGRKVSADKIEDVLKSIRSKREVAVLGLPDSEWGELVSCFFTGNEAGAREILQTCKKALQSWEVPKRYYSVSSLPRTALGKVDRNQLVQSASQFPFASTKDF